MRAMTSSEQPSKSLEASRRLFYCPDCSRVYFLSAGKSYLCGRQLFNTFYGTAHVWIIPARVGHSSRGGSAFEWEDCDLEDCYSSPHGSEYRGRGHDEHITREEFMKKYTRFVLQEVESA